MRYAYGVAMALLLGGTAFSVATGQAGAQVAQNAPGAIVPRAGAPASFADLAARLQPAVVNISTKQRVPVRRQVDPFEEFFRRFGGQAPQGGSGGQVPPDGNSATREAGSLGSGFIISPDGYVVTNNHLIQGANGQGTVDSVTVILADRKEYPARIIGRDSASDLALLKIEGSNLPFVNFGDSTRARVGDWVVAIGNPYGLGGTVTAGIISAVHRGGISGGGAYDRYIQTDASINMGNSGGPMFDMAGNVIGVNSALISPTGASVGIGLAIPAEAARPVIDALRRGQRPARGYFGVGLQPVDEDIAAGLGLPKDQGELVRSVVPGGPAAAAGLQQGDVILRVNGQTVTPDETASYIIANTSVGTSVPIDIIRDGRRQTLRVRVAQRPTEEELARQAGGANPSEGQALGEETPVAPGTALGLSLQALNPQIITALGLPPAQKGVVVTAVDPASDAATKGIARGFVIVSVNRQAVTEPAQVLAAVEAARRAGRTSVLMLVKPRTGPEAFVGVDISGR
ncbi:Do family serine endopeptidase [Sphingomonas sp. LY29]|uniref:Do family serine endopeptidase n=1 Tax=Sphingomonas sp. LY29 TaxID=3095341 RepID=UPI002D789F54|nr:Do family serine endopeptidase [Sphingomonas sp. LY29]WRP25345.1 Do family serine endopeptidase [Sphingomonas sp. LY29]